MNIKPVVEELKNKRHITEKQFLILDLLIIENLTAQQLSKKTKIPLGRIYEPLNQLISNKLIEKIGKKPSKYVFENSNERILEFLQNKFHNFVKDENKIIDMLDDKTPPRIDLLRSTEDFTFSLLKLLSSCKSGLKTIARYGSLPFIFYPSTKQEFIQMREVIDAKRTTIAHTTQTKSIRVFNAYHEALKKNKHFYAICNKDTFLWHINLIKKNLGQDFLDRMIADFRRKCKQYDIKLYIIEEYLPMQVFVIHNQIMLFHIHMGIGSGLEIHNKEVVQLYEGMFKDMVKRSKSAEYYLKRIK